MNRDIQILYCILTAASLFLLVLPSDAQESRKKAEGAKHEQLAGTAAKLVGQWVIDVPRHPGLQLFLRFNSDGTYSTHPAAIDAVAAETGKIRAHSGNYILIALTGELSGKRDEGSYQFIGNDRLLLRGLFGKGTWTKVDETGRRLAPLSQDGGLSKEARPNKGTPAATKPVDEFEQKKFIPEVIGTAVPTGRNASESESEVEGTAAPYGRNELPGSRTSGFTVPLQQRDLVPLVANTNTQTTAPPEPTPFKETDVAVAISPAAVSPGLTPPSIVTVAASTTSKNRPIKDKWALVVGISKFQNSQLNLKCPAKDASDFGKFLVEQCHFAEDHVRVITDNEATRSRILNELGDKWLPRVVRPDDLVIVYLSTHGSPADADVGGVNYLLACDTDPESLYSSGLPMQDLTRIIKGRLRSDRVMMVLDACYSGNVTPQSKGIFRGANVDVEEIAQGTGQLVISSSQPNQVSWESKSGDNSVFTKHLMSALRVHGDRTTLAEAFETLRDRVEDEVQRDRGRVQIPVMKSQWEGHDLIISVPPVAPRPGL